MYLLCFRSQGLPFKVEGRPGIQKLTMHTYPESCIWSIYTEICKTQIAQSHANTPCGLWSSRNQVPMHSWRAVGTQLKRENIISCAGLHYPVPIFLQHATKAAWRCLISSSAVLKYMPPAFGFMIEIDTLWVGSQAVHRPETLRKTTVFSRILGCTKIK